MADNTDTTQQFIDDLIMTIWNAEDPESITNDMVARVLDSLNNRVKNNIAVANEKQAREDADKVLSNAISVLNTALITVETIANVSKSAATAAKETADTAKTTADAAKTAADTAKATANTAKTTANSALEKINNLKPATLTADGLMSKEDKAKLDDLENATTEKDGLMSKEDVTRLDKTEEKADKALAEAFVVVEFSGILVPPSIPTWTKELFSSSGGRYADEGCAVWFNPEAKLFYFDVSSGSSHTLYPDWGDGDRFGSYVPSKVIPESSFGGRKPLEHRVYYAGGKYYVWDGENLVCFADLTDSTLHQKALDAASIKTFVDLWKAIGGKYLENASTKKFQTDKGKNLTYEEAVSELITRINANIALATVENDGLMSKEDKAKLDDLDNATTEKDGLMSKEDKSKLNKMNHDIKEDIFRLLGSRAVVITQLGDDSEEAVCPELMAHDDFAFAIFAEVGENKTLSPHVCWTKRTGSDISSGVRWIGDLSDKTAEWVAPLREVVYLDHGVLCEDEQQVFTLNPNMTWVVISNRADVRSGLYKPTAPDCLRLEFDRPFFVDSGNDKNAFDVAVFSFPIIPSPNWIKDAQTDKLSTGEGCSVIFDTETKLFFLKVTEETGTRLYGKWGDSDKFGTFATVELNGAAVTGIRPVEHRLYAAGSGLYIWNGEDLVNFYTPAIPTQKDFDAAAVKTFNAIWESEKFGGTYDSSRGGSKHYRYGGEDQPWLTFAQAVAKFVELTKNTTYNAKISVDPQTGILRITNLDQSVFPDLEHLTVGSFNKIGSVNEFKSHIKIGDSVNLPDNFDGDSLRGSLGDDSSLGDGVEIYHEDGKIKIKTITRGVNPDGDEVIEQDEHAQIGAHSSIGNGVNIPDNFRVVTLSTTDSDANRDLACLLSPGFYAVYIEGSGYGSMQFMGNGSGEIIGYISIPTPNGKTKRYNLSYDYALQETTTLSAARIYHHALHLNDEFREILNLEDKSGDFMMELMNQAQLEGMCNADILVLLPPDDQSSGLYFTRSYSRLHGDADDVVLFSCIDIRYDEPKMYSLRLLPSRMYAIIYARFIKLMD